MANDATYYHSGVDTDGWFKIGMMIVAWFSELLLDEIWWQVWGLQNHCHDAHAVFQAFFW